MIADILEQASAKVAAGQTDEAQELISKARAAVAEKQQSIEGQLAQQQPVDLKAAAQRGVDEGAGTLKSYSFTVSGTVATTLEKNEVDTAIRDAFKGGLTGSSAVGSTVGPMHNAELNQVAVTDQPQLA